MGGGRKGMLAVTTFFIKRLNFLHSTSKITSQKRHTFVYTEILLTLTRYAEDTHGTHIDNYFTHNSIAYINWEYSDTYSEDRIQTQICNYSTPWSVITANIWKWCHGFVLKMTSMGLWELIFNLHLVFLSWIRNTHTYTHT